MVSTLPLAIPEYSSSALSKLYMEADREIYCYNAACSERYAVFAILYAALKQTVSSTQTKHTLTLTVLVATVDALRHF